MSAQSGRASRPRQWPVAPHRTRNRPLTRTAHRAHAHPASSRIAVYQGLPLVSPFPCVCVEPDGSVRVDGSRPLALLPGSFNPLHRGHRELAAIAAARLGVPVAFELSVVNVDKPELPAEEVIRRVIPFRGIAPVWVTRAATFATKAELFPGVAFVLGFDTAIRLIDPRYYGHDVTARDVMLRTLLANGCRVVVGGRVDEEGRFQTWTGDELAPDLRTLFLPLAEADFRVDVSSTALRQCRE